MIRKNIHKFEKIILFFILVISAIFHLTYIRELGQTPYISYPLVDGDTYYEKATNILKDGWLGDRIFFQAPLYPYLIAIILKLFGPGKEIVVWIQAGSSILSIYLIYLIGRRLFSSEIGLISAGISSFYGIFVFPNPFTFDRYKRSLPPKIHTKSSKKCRLRRRGKG